MPLEGIYCNQNFPKKKIAYGADMASNTFCLAPPEGGEGKRQVEFYFIDLFWRSPYEEGTPHCRFRRESEALGAGRIHLSVLGIPLYNALSFL
jgi:hypothetical protein